VPSSPTPNTPGRTEVERLVTQIRRLEARSGRRAASVFVVVPKGVDPELIATLLAKRLGTEVEAHVEEGAVVCRITTVDFELLDDPTMEEPPTTGGSR
jgi:hypothetical protein